MTQPPLTTAMEAMKWHKLQNDHLNYCESIRGPEHEHWIENDKCSENCLAANETIRTALAMLDGVQREDADAYRVIFTDKSSLIYFTMDEVIEDGCENKIDTIIPLYAAAPLPQADGERG